MLKAENISYSYDDGTKEILNYYQNDKGFIEFKLKKDAIINIDYIGTKADNLSILISIITLCGCATYLIITRKKYN